MCEGLTIAAGVKFGLGILAVSLTAGAVISLIGLAYIHFSVKYNEHKRNKRNKG